MYNDKDTSKEGCKKLELWHNSQFDWILSLSMKKNASGLFYKNHPTKFPTKVLDQTSNLISLHFML